MEGKAEQAVAPAGNGQADSSRAWTALYLLLALPLSLFLYLNAFQEATSFFGGSYGSVVLRAPVVSLLMLSALGGWVVWRLPLLRRGWWVGAWLLLGVAAGAVLRQPELYWRQAAAVAVCLPAWLSLRARWSGLGRQAIKPAGGLKSWVQNGLLVTAALVLSFTANTLWICLTFPEFHVRWQERVFLAGRVASLAAAPALAALSVVAPICALLGRFRYGSHCILGLLGAGFFGGSGLILFNGLSRLDPTLVRPANFLYACVLALPLAVIFCERLATSGPSLAAALLTCGRPRLTAGWDTASPVGRFGHLLLCLALFVTVQCVIGTAHRYYEWGFGTSLFYCAVGVGCTWWLLTSVPRQVQTWASAICLCIAAGGSFTCLPRFYNPAVWAHYIKFDNNLGSLVRAYHRRYPRTEPAFQAGRRLLEGSFAMAPTNVIVLRQQSLVAEHAFQPPDVFFIVTDSLRAATYGAGHSECDQLFPGIEWMSRRFVMYTNAWSSYNATLGSYPAYLNGVLNPVWYQFTVDWPIQHDNLLARAAALAGYTIYNLATFDNEFVRIWPTNSAVELGNGGLGQGDPAVVFPRALAVLDRHRNSEHRRPALFYVHLYNVHQPLLRRPGVPFHDKGRHWMRALYEQNAAYLDLHLKAFLQQLEQRHILGNALVLVTGDHGEEVFDLGGLYHGWQINPWVMQVPLYVHYPDVTPKAPSPGTALSRPVNLIDLTPTICQLMGVPVIRDSPYQGVSLLAPEPVEPRSFLLLSWETPLVGRVSFSPLRLVVLNFESGQEEGFVPSDHGWSMSAAPVPPIALAESLTHELRGLFRYWRMEPEQGTYLPLPAAQPR